jgi:hypothetical protein
MPGGHTFNCNINFHVTTDWSQDVMQWQGLDFYVWIYFAYTVNSRLSGLMVGM